MIAYKVLDSDQRSAVVSGEASIYYGQNQWTLPKFNGRLFVFKRLKDARDFKTIDQRVWRCEVPSLTSIKEIAPYFSVTDMIRFWDKETVEAVKKMSPPQGSYTAPKVKLLNKL